MKSIPPKDQNIILATLSGIPLVHLRKKCRTEDQLNHWNVVRLIFQDVRTSMKAYFSGKENPIQNQSEIYTLGTKRYLDLYSLIWDGWIEIKQLAKEIDAKIPSSPGEYVAACIENESLAIFEQCQTYTEYRPQKQYRFSLESSKIEQLKKSKSLSVKDKNRIRKFDSEVKKLRHNFPKFWALHDFALAVTRSSRKRVVKMSLERYEAICLELENAILKDYNPANRRQGATWIKGNLVYKT